MFQIVLILLALVDILSGLFLLFRNLIPFPSLFLYIGYVMGIKGLWSIFTSFGMKHYFDFMGFIDLITGICLIAIHNWNFDLGFFWAVGILVILKGIWTSLFSF